MPSARFPADEEEFAERDDAHPGRIVLRRTGSNGDGRVLVETTLGRLLFKEAFPSDFQLRSPREAVQKR